MTTTPKADSLVAVEALRARLQRLFASAGLSPVSAAHMAEALVDADIEGVPSHGTLQAGRYIRRLLLGSISKADKAEVVVDAQSVAVLDAHHMFGHIAADQAIALALEKARQFGSGVVAVRHGFHFGVAGRYARVAAEAGCVGIAMSNVRPLIPAPGGAEPVVGNNPLAIALPTAGAMPIVLDMAMSEAALAKIRVAQARGESIPPTWAVDAQGVPTTDPAAALGGMLQPMGGAKGFGLAFVIDLMCGLLSNGAWGDAVNGMYADPKLPLDCAYLFIAIDIPHFRSLDDFKREASTGIDRIHNSKRAASTARATVPGERKWEARLKHTQVVPLAAAVDQALRELEAELRIGPEDDN